MVARPENPTSHAVLESAAIARSSSVDLHLMVQVDTVLSLTEKVKKLSSLTLYELLEWTVLISMHKIAAEISIFLCLVSSWEEVEWCW